MQLPTQNKLESMSKEEFDSFLVDIEGSIDLLSEEQLQDLHGMIGKVEEMQEIEKARTDFETFVRICGPSYLKFSSKGQHHQLADTFERVADGPSKRVTISMPPRFGKALSVDEVVPTPSGWSRMGDLKIGDDVFASDGSIAKVKHVSPIWKDRKVFSVKPKSGYFPIIADEAHEWQVRLCRKHKLFTKQETGFLYERQSKMTAWRAPMIKMGGCLDLPEADLPIPPYTLGVWLGDGHAYSGNVAQSGPCTEQVLGGVMADGFELRQCATIKDHTVLGLFKLLRENGLIKNKHIPQAYLRSSKEQRMLLLNGLVDTDGHCDPKSACIEIVSVNKTLALGYKELVNSLGVKCGFIEDRATLNGKDCGPRYRVTFWMKGASTVPYKNDFCRDGVKFNNHYIKVDPAGISDTVCIEIDHPSHLFLAGRDMVPTCNSEFSSICLPAWYLGKYPDQKVIQASSVDKNAIEFGRKVKAIIDSPMFRKVFPGVSISKDSKASGKFATNKGGTYYAVGVGTAIAGKGADLCILDDITSEQEAQTGRIEAFDPAWQWFLAGPQQRLQPGGRIIVIATRWHKGDVIGRLKKRMKEDPRADKYESIEFTALDENDESNFPEIWPTEELIAKRANTIPYMWNAQYMQAPTTESGSIVSRSMWKKWDQYKRIPNSNEVEFVPPSCSLVMMVLDTAFTNNKRSNPTAMTVWGCFKHMDSKTGVEVPCLILIHSHKKKMEFPELKAQAKIWIKEWQPDITLIEAKSSGPMLISELNQAGIPALGVTPKPLEDKISRMNSITSVFASGMVWYMPTYANEACIDEVNDFPNGDQDDYSDTCAYAVRHFRNSGMVAPSDDLDWGKTQDEGTTQGRSYY